MKALLDIVRRHRAGEAAGIYSVCSAHPLVLRAALEHACASGGYALIEATSNQVNQEGGYTGLRPAQFRDRVFGMADEVGLARELVLLGVDHLGPNAWQSLESGQALRRAGVMIAEYVSAGFRKIHLDCSMSCADAVWCAAWSMPAATLPHSDPSRSWCIFATPRTLAACSGGRRSRMRRWRQAAGPSICCNSPRREIARSLI